MSQTPKIMHLVRLGLSLQILHLSKHKMLHVDVDVGLRP